MSCNRDAENCTSTAGAYGAPEAVAVWAAGRSAAGHCPNCGGFLDANGVCRNAACGQVSLAQGNGRLKQRPHCPHCGEFMTAEGICQNDTCGWVQNAARIVSIAAQSGDPAQLDRLAHLKKYPQVRAAVAANPNTTPQTLAVLATDKNTPVYRAAIANPELPLEALVFAGQKAQVDWQKSLQIIAGRISMSAMYYGAFSLFSGRGGQRGQPGEPMIAAAMLGVYGFIAYKPYRRQREIRTQAQQRRMGITEETGTRENTGAPVMTPMDSSGVSEVAQNFGLSQKEQDLFNDGLDIAVSFLETTKAGTASGLNIADLEAIRERGPQTDRDREFLGGVFDELAQTEETLPGFFNATPAEFQVLRDKLECSAAVKAAVTAA